MAQTVDEAPVRGDQLVVPDRTTPCRSGWICGRSGRLQAPDGSDRWGNRGTAPTGVPWQARLQATSVAIASVAL